MVDIRSAFPKGHKELLAFVQNVNDMHRQIVSAENPYIDHFYLSYSPDELCARISNAGLHKGAVQKPNNGATRELCVTVNPILKQIGTSLEEVYEKIRTIARYTAQQSWAEMADPDRSIRIDRSSYDTFHQCLDIMNIKTGDRAMYSLIGDVDKDSFQKIDRASAFESMDMSLFLMGIVKSKLVELDGPHKMEIEGAAEDIEKWSGVPKQELLDSIFGKNLNQITPTAGSPVAVLK